MDSDIDALLVRFEKLKHLVLDNCTIVGDRRMMSDDLTWWSVLGSRCALTGVKRAREREKNLKAWLEAHSSNNRSTGGQHPSLPVPTEARRPRPGRKGLATATVSLRLPAPPSGPSITANERVQSQITTGPPLKVHIIPPLPTLLSLSISPLTASGGHVAFSPATRASIMAGFKSGWEDGLRVLRERRSRLATTFLRSTAVGQNVRFLKFKDGNEGHGDEEGFEGLAGVGSGDESMFCEAGNGDGPPISRDPPILCLHGLGHEDQGHTARCGHSVALGIWAEGL
jgi:hypothetical protein